MNKVISENTAKIYTTTGHGENALSASLAELMEKANFTVEELNTMMKEEIPEDCELLILNGPTTDLTGDEKTMISNYLQEGNDVILILGNGEKETPNLDLLMKEYGLEVAEGYIADTERCYQQNPYYIFPVLSVSGEMAEGIESQMVMMVNARGMQKVDPIRETITVEEFMTTSENGYAVTEEGESQGTYLLGAMATEEESTFAVISSYTMIDEYLTESLTTLENNTLFMNVVTSNFEEVTTIAIEAKSLAVEYNTMQYVGVSSLIVIFGIPLAILVLGFVRWLKRRKA